MWHKSFISATISCGRLCADFFDKVNDETPHRETIAAPVFNESSNRFSTALTREKHTDENKVSPHAEQSGLPPR